MATKITVVLEDDLDGGPADETVRFGLDGVDYEIDLSRQHARAFRREAAMAMPRQVSTMAPGSVLRHRYRLDGRIALGGVGEVWRGTDLVLERVVAVKLLRPEYAQDEECLARFRAEGRHAALLSHPQHRPGLRLR